MHPKAPNNLSTHLWKHDMPQGFNTSALNAEAFVNGCIQGSEWLTDWKHARRM